MHEIKFADTILQLETTERDSALDETDFAPRFNLISSLIQNSAPYEAEAQCARLDKRYVSEFVLSAPQIRGHILFAHFDPEIFTLYGNPIYDLELLALRGDNAQWVANKLVGLLEGDRVTDKKGESLCFDDSNTATRSTLREGAIATLRHMELLGLAKVPWERVEAHSPDARKGFLVLYTYGFNSGGLLD